MIDRWHNDDYLIVFDEPIEALTLAERYAIATALPGFSLVGIKSWDDFIVRDATNRLFTVPTVPLDSQHLRPLDLSNVPSKLRTDERFKGKIRWFIKPIIFGGDPAASSNTAWLTLEEHIGVVKWWNQMHGDLKSKMNSKS